MTNDNKNNDKIYKELVKFCQSKDIDNFKKTINVHPEIINYKTSNNWNLMHIAAYFDFDKGISLLINAGLNINEKDSSGTTPILLSISNKSLNATNLLIEFSADLNLSNNKGYTPLMSACCNADAELLERLLKIDNDTTKLDIKDVYGMTAVDYAKKNKNKLISDNLNYDKLNSIIEKIILEKQTSGFGFKQKSQTFKI